MLKGNGGGGAFDYTELNLHFRLVFPLHRYEPLFVHLQMRRG